MIPRRIAIALLLLPRLANGADAPPPTEGALRVATYNVAMYRESAGELTAELATGESDQARAIAEVIQRVRPDVLLLCEIDYDAGKDPARDPVAGFADRYLAVSQGAGLAAIAFPHRFTAPVNTGVPSGLDLDADGASDGPADAWGYGRYPGQYGMAVLSRLPIDRSASRTFKNLRWADLPKARKPTWPNSSEPFYADAVWRQLRLPSKSLWDVVVRPPSGEPLHLIASHPTPPVFDGPEDRNGRRNADEVRLVREYVEGGLADHFVDDAGKAGALPKDRHFVVLGDLNADPLDGSGDREAIRRLIHSDALADDPKPRSLGALLAKPSGFNAAVSKRGDPQLDTGDFGRDGGNLRIDYALPSATLLVTGAGVYWPRPDEPGAKAVTASDHRLVWVDVSLPD